MGGGGRGVCIQGGLRQRGSASRRGLHPGGLHLNFMTGPCFDSNLRVNSLLVEKITHFHFSFERSLTLNKTSAGPLMSGT